MRLVSCGISLDVMDGRLKQTTLHLAAFAGNTLVLDWILHAGASIDKQVSISLIFLLVHSILRIFNKPYRCQNGLLEGLVWHFTCIYWLPFSKMWFSKIAYLSTNINFLINRYDLFKYHILENMESTCTCKMTCKTCQESIICGSF